MINENTLNKLNNIGFGADIDSLESYIIDFKQASLLTDMRKYDYNYSILFDILKEVKPNSLAFSERTSLNEIEFDKYDILFQEFGNPEIEQAYGVKSVVVNNMKNNIDYYETKLVDIVALTNVEGIDISCIYLHGYLYRIYAIGNYKKYINLTKELKSNIPNHVEEFEEFELVEMRGKATIFKGSEALQDSLNIPCAVVRNIRNQFTDEIKIVFNDMMIAEEEEFEVELPYENQWDKIAYMRELGFSVPHHALLINIDRDTLEQALLQLDEHFKKIKDSGEIVYEYNGLLITFGSNIDYSALEDRLIYISDNSDATTKYSSTVKSISTTFDGEKYIQKLNIIRTKCNDNLFIKSIELEDIYDLEKYDVYIGSKINFIVVEGKAILSD